MSLSHFHLFSHKKKRKPVKFSFHPGTFAFEIDNKDENFKRGLRRKSLTGQTPHSISRQISNGKVNIPVEHVDDHSDFDGTIAEGPSETTRVTFPEQAECENNARWGESSHTGKGHESQKSTAKKVVPIPVHHESKESTCSPYTKLFEQLDDCKHANTPKASQGYGRAPYDPKKYEDQWSVKDNPPSGDRQNSDNSLSDDVPIRESLEKLKIREKSLRQNQEKCANISAQEENEIEMKKQDVFIAKEYNLHRFLIIPDGNCLYRAIAQAVLLDQGQHMLLRQLTIDHIREHKNEFENIIEGDVEDFLIAAQLEGEWAGYPEILALSRLLEININITTGGMPSNPTVHTTLHYFEPDCQKEKDGKKSRRKNSDKYTDRQSIWLSWLSNGHYDTFTGALIENPCYQEWLLSRKSRLESDAAMANQMYDEAVNKRDHENLLRYQQNEWSDPHKENPPTLPSTSHQNRDVNNIVNTNINNVLYPDSSDEVLPPQYYPPPTYSNRGVSPNRGLEKERPPPYSSVGVTTELDEAIARSLQEEEKDKFSDSYFA